VLVAGPSHFDRLEPLRARFPEVRFDWSGAHPPEGLAEADVLVAFRVPDAWIEAAPRLAWVHSSGAGADEVIGPALIRRGIAVSSSRGAFDEPVAEHAVALLLALARGLPVLTRAQAERRWPDFFGLPSAVELAGRTLCVLGFGSIGARVGEIARAIGMRVIGVRRRPRPHPAAERVVGLDGLHAALAEADALCIVLPDAPGTRMLVGRAELELLRPGALVVNVGRGSSLDDGAVADLLASGRLGGAGLDVTDPEPPPEGSPLWSAPNLILTGHTAGYSDHHPERPLAVFGDNLAAWIAGEALPGHVDPELGY
jgi:phosphoglycerate dehydrogenase-like enzyme